MKRMRVCAGCEHEFDEEARFCPMCGRPIGGSAAGSEKARLDQALRANATDAMREATLERAYAGAGQSVYDRPTDLEHTPATRAAADIALDPWNAPDIPHA